MSEHVPHTDIKLVLTDTIFTLNNLAQKYERIYETQSLNALNNSLNNTNVEQGDLLEESEITSYKLNYIYWLIDLINDSPWFNNKHKCHSGTKI